MTIIGDDPLGGYDDLDPRQQAAVKRMSARAARHGGNLYQPTNRDRWADFTRAADADEQDRFSNS
ncbi:MAG: hypothetical protein ABWZ77_05165 [Naasia sp.]